MQFKEYLLSLKDKNEQQLYKQGSVNTYVSQFLGIVKRLFPTINGFTEVPSRITEDMIYSVNGGKAHPVTEHFNSWWSLYSIVGAAGEIHPHGNLTDATPTVSSAPIQDVVTAPSSSVYRPFQKWAHNWTYFGIPLPDPNLCLLLHMLYSAGSQSSFGFTTDTLPFEMPMTTVDIRDLRWGQFRHANTNDSRRNPNYYMLRHKDAPDYQPYGWRVPGTIVRDMAMIHAKMNSALINYAYPLGVPDSNVVASIPGSPQLLMDDDIFQKFFTLNNALAILAMGNETKYSYDMFFAQWQAERK